MANEQQFIDNRRAEFGGNLNKPMEEIGKFLEEYNYEPMPASDYESENGVPYVIDKLNLRTAFSMNSRIITQAKAVDEFVRKQLSEEELHDSVKTYESVLERFFSKLPEPLERMMQQKQGGKILEFLFREAAIAEGKSGQSFVKISQERQAKKRIASLVGQLQNELALIK